jgi:hypothetical protein
MRVSGSLLLALGLTYGILGDAILRAFPWGMGATLLATTLTFVVVWLQDQSGTRAGPRRVAYVLAALALAAGWAWRDAAVLKTLDTLALIVTLGLLGSEREDQEGGRSLSSTLLRVSGTAVHTCLLWPPLLLTHDVDWSWLRAGQKWSSLLGVARGVLLTLPLLLVFTALLGKADPVFALRVEELLDVDLEALIGHLALGLVYGWLAVGFLRAAVLRARPAHQVPSRLPFLALGRIEIALALGSLDLLFAAFVWIQLRYLFGGAQWVQRVAGLTYAEYARSGFFELVTVTALVLPLLLAAHWLLNPVGRAETRMFAALAGVQVLLVLVMLASALERMRLYRAEFGLTQLRFYSTVFMAWLAVLLVWFLLTVLRGRRDAFATGVLASAFATLLVLHVVDPEEQIVRANAALARAFDVGYALKLGADAAPALLQTTRSLDDTRRAALARGLLNRWSDPRAADWRSWSVGRARALRVVADADADLRAMALEGPEGVAGR